MELLQIRYFADAAATENFSLTAKKHLIPQSTVSQAIKKLELELGVKLFDRKGNKVSLNDNGKLFKKSVDAALSEIDGATRALKESASEVRGEVNLLIQTNRRIVTECILDFKKLYPNVSFYLCHEYFDNDFEKFDLCIGDKVFGLKNIEKELLVSEDICLAVSNEHTFANKKSVHISELKNERFISMTTNRSLHNFLLSICREQGFEPNVAIQCDDPYYLREYVALNLGVALFPEFSWQGMYDNNAVSFIKLKGADLRRDTYVYWKKSKYVSNIARLFKNHLIKYK